MKRLKVSISLAVLCVATSCAPHKDPDDDFQVIAIVVKQLCQQKTHGYYVLSSATSVVDPFVTSRISKEPGQESLMERNKDSAPLPLVESCASLRIVDKAEIDRYMEIPIESRPMGFDAWSAFYAGFKGAQGLLTLSLPGYSTQRDIAIVQVAGACGELCGNGSFWILRKVSGRWQFEKSVQGWIS